MFQDLSHLHQLRIIECISTIEERIKTSSYGVARYLGKDSLDQRTNVFQII